MGYFDIPVDHVHCQVSKLGMVVDFVTTTCFLTVLFFLSFFLFPLACDP